MRAHSQARRTISRYRLQGIALRKLNRNRNQGRTGLVTIDATIKFSPKQFAQICNVSVQYAYLIFGNPTKCSYFRWAKYLAKCVDAQALAMQDAQAILRRAYHAHAQRDTSPTALTLALECCK